MLATITKSAGMASAGGEHNGGARNQGSQHYSAPGPPVPFVNEHGQAPQRTYASRSASIGSKQSASAPTSPTKPPKPLATAPGKVVSEGDASNPEAEALRRTAEEAIAAVTRKRCHDESMRATAANPQSDSAAVKQAYAKRKKKPRMSDCETRLAQLRAENEKLKRHLDNITNQTAKNEQNRLKAEATMKQMMENSETPTEELDAVIREYSEAYSDYGRRRHEELSFHLEQLQKLANPTNFTKMALWTIAKANDSKDASQQNPLIGILQKELNIAAPQIRKILDQKQKIRLLCSNLSSVLELIHQLKDLCEQKNKKFNDRMTKTREILTPKQVVKLIMWIKDYSDVLGNICPGWTSEQMMKRKAPQKAGASAEKTLAVSGIESEKPSPSHSQVAGREPSPSQVASSSPPKASIELQNTEAAKTEPVATTTKTEAS